MRQVARKFIPLSPETHTRELKRLSDSKASSIEIPTTQGGNCFSGGETR